MGKGEVQTEDQGTSVPAATAQAPSSLIPLRSLERGFFPFYIKKLILFGDSLSMESTLALNS